MKVYFQNHGFLHCDLRWLLIAKDFASRTNQQPATHWGEVPTLSLVIDHPEGRFLFDTSCPRDWEDRWGAAGINEVFPYDNVKDDEYLDSSIKKLGLEPSDFKAVILSHLHFDHAGNLRVFEGSGARYVAQKAEKQGALGIAGEFAGAFVKKDYQNGFEIDTVEGDQEFAKGVTLISLPGHTWGTMGVLLELASGPILYTSDAVYMRDSYGPPPVGSPIVWSNLEWLSSVEKVRKLAEQRNAKVVFGHDYDMVTKDLKLAPAYYE